MMFKFSMFLNYVFVYVSEFQPGFRATVRRSGPIFFMKIATPMQLEICSTKNAYYIVENAESYQNWIPQPRQQRN